MLKRRNWRTEHGTGPREQDDSGSGSATDSEAPSNQEDLDSEEVSEASGDEGLELRRLEDLTDSEAEEDSEAQASGGSEQSGSSDLGSGSEAAESDGEPYWAPRRCKLCPGILLLNEATLEAHTASRKHVKRLGSHPGDTFDPICLAEDVQDTAAKLETYTERLQRVRASSAKQQPAQASVQPAGSLPRPQKRQKKPKKQQAERKRPGKRQRAAAKQAAGPA